MSSAALSPEAIIGVIGAGAMGSGIAQVAAQAGHPVLLCDAKPGAAAAAVAKLSAALTALEQRGKLAAGAAQEITGRIRIADSLEAMAGAALVIEAVVEDLAVKQQIFGALEGILDAGAILATNTSSISVTAIASGLSRPERLVGMHFFNPAPVMKLVEVVSGLASSPDVAACVHATATAWGKVAVHARSTPGFIVNRVARAYYGEPLRLLEEGTAAPADFDALFTGAGFRMGPFALMDLIGMDVNYAVSCSVFAAFYQEPRFRPSLLQHEMVAAGQLGRKSGRGFYEYSEGSELPQPAVAAVPDGATPWALAPLGEAQQQDGVTVALSDGRTAAEMARALGGPVILHDLVPAAGQVIGYTLSPDVSAAAEAAWLAGLAAQELRGLRLPDRPGLVVLRTIAMIANEGFEAVLQGVALETDIDLAMRFGVNYPQGPMAWARKIGLARVVSVLSAVQQATGDMRYRPSLALRSAAG